MLHSKINLDPPLNWRIKSSKNFPQNYAVPGLFFKNYSGDEVDSTFEGIFHLINFKKYILMGSRKILPRQNSQPENSHPSNSPLENCPWKIPTQKTPTWNIFTHFINCLSSLNNPSINVGRVYMCILLLGQIILKSPERLKVIPWNFGSINNIFIKNTWPANFFWVCYHFGRQATNSFDTPPQVWVQDF